MTSPTPQPQHTVTLSDHTVTTLHELLALCEEFLRTAGPTVHAELRAYLGQHVADPGWLIDMLGFHVMHLGHQLGCHTPHPPEIWQQTRPDQQPGPSREVTR